MKYIFYSVIVRFSSVSNCDPSAPDAANCDTNLPVVVADSDTIKNVLGLAFGVIAGVALLIMVLQGLKFVLSKGEPEKAAEARKAIIYAAVGLGIALLAEAIVVLVLGKLV